MIDLFLPLIIGIGIGISPPADDFDEGVAPEIVAEALPEVDQGSGDDLSDAREPEPQIPMGKYTTALEVRPILQMTRNQWVGVREFDGQDYVYFSTLIGWRCGLWDIRYGINGAPADNVLPMEPCNDEFAQPNVMLDIENFPPYVICPQGGVESIYVEIVFDDGTTDFARFERAAVRIP